MSQSCKVGDMCQADFEGIESTAYLQEQLITYLGNKRALLPFIGGAVDKVKTRLGKKKLRTFDVFSGTGVVARYLKQHSSYLVASDLERYSEVTNACYLSNRSELDESELQWHHRRLVADIGDAWAPGFIADMYSPVDDLNIQPGERVFFTRRNAVFLDTARRLITDLPSDLQKFFLAPLISRASVHANTSGVFKGFYKNKQGIGQFGGSGQDALARIMRPIELPLPVLSRFECEYEIARGDANELVDRFGAFDLAYLDPPYNQHPYGSNYFMLNILADYEPPGEVSLVSGIPSNWNRSRYNQRRNAGPALFDLVEKCPASHILISYNCEGFIGHEEFVGTLGKFGALSVMSTPYNTFRGSRNLADRAKHVTEFLYLLEKN